MEDGKGKIQMKKINYWIIATCFGLFTACDNTPPKSDLEPSTHTEIDSVRFEDTIHAKGRIVKIEPITRKEYENQISHSQPPLSLIEEPLSYDSSFIKLLGEIHHIQLLNDSSILLSNVSNEDDIENYVHYSYLGSFDGSDLIVFKCSYYESYDFLIVNRKNGQQTHVWGEPSLSTDKNYVLSTNNDLHAGFTPNGIQVFKVGEMGLTLEFEKEFEKWGPQFPKWVDDKTIYLTQISYNLIDGNEEANYAKLILK